MPHANDQSRIGELLGGGLIVGDRERQEDEYMAASFDAADTDGCALLVVVADGMGGHAGGAEASRRAVAGYFKTFGDPGADRGGNGGEGGLAKRLRVALDGANDAVGKDRWSRRELLGMGCTLVACAVTESGKAHWVSVGDSMLLHLRGGSGGTIARLNEDHSARPQFEEMVRAGRMTPEEFETAPVHQLYSAVMGGRIEMIDEGAPPVQLEPGDRIVVATDGLETLSHEEVQERCGEDRAMAEVAGEVLAAIKARAKPHQDNATIVAYRHPAGPFPGRVGKERRRLLGPRR